MGDVHGEAPNYQAAYHLRLAEKLRGLGLVIVPTKDAFEIAGLPKELSDKFSRRTKKINETAARLGITDPKQKARLGAMTRESKDKTPLISELQQFWWADLDPAHEQALKAAQATLRRSLITELSASMVNLDSTAQNVRLSGRSSEKFGSREQGQVARRQSMNQRTKPESKQFKEVAATEHERHAVWMAVKHLFERKSVVSELELLGEAARSWRHGDETYAGIKAAAAELPLIRKHVKGQTLVTTPEVLAEEKQLIEWCQSGKGKHEPLNSFWQIEDQLLNEQQRQAVVHALNSPDWVTGISGRAGTGKTTLLNELRRGVERGMFKFLALAPTSEAARDGLRKEGFQNADTVAKLLVNEKLQNEFRGGVWLVDEAGLLSMRQAVRLFALAKKLEARMILMGDLGQHFPVERGQALHLLERFGDLSMTRVEEIQRQKGDYKKLVELVAGREVEGAFDLLRKNNWIEEMSFETRKLRLANDYIDALECGETALVVAPTHAERAEVTDGIREQLKARGRLKNGVAWEVLENLSWTDAQKSDHRHFRKGQIVQFNRHVKGFGLGERVEVIGIRDGLVRVRSHGPYQTRIKALPLGQPDTFNVYLKEKMEICEGERLRVTTNTITKDGHRLSNGQLYTVDYVDPSGRLVLDNGWRLDKNFLHLQHGYTLTSHSAQGKTVDVVLVAQTARLSSLASDLNQFYVSISRARQRIKIYTDDIDLLLSCVSRVRERPMATEMLAQPEDVEPPAPSPKISRKFGRLPLTEIVKLPLEMPPVPKTKKEEIVLEL